MRQNIQNVSNFWSFDDNVVSLYYFSTCVYLKIILIFNFITEIKHMQNDKVGILGFSREIKPIGDTHTHTHTHIYLEDKKSHNLPLKLETQENQKGNSESKGLKTMGADGWSLSSGSEKLRRDVPAQWVRKEKNKQGKTPPSSMLCSVHSLNGLDDACSHWGGKSTYWVYPDSNANFIPKHPHKYTPVMNAWLS